MSTASWHPADPASGRPLQHDLERTVAELVHCVAQRGQLVLLDGPTGSGKTAVLARLNRRLPPRFRCVRLSGSARPVGGQSARILAQLGIPPSANPRRSLEWHVQRMERRGKLPVLLVDDADLLPRRALRWLLALTSGAIANATVVLATKRYRDCVEALDAGGACVSIVRLRGRTQAPRAGGVGSPVAGPRPATPLARRREPIVERARPIPAAPRAARALDFADRSLPSSPRSARRPQSRHLTPWLGAAVATLGMGLGVVLWQTLPSGDTAPPSPGDATRTRHTPPGMGQPVPVPESVAGPPEGRTAVDPPDRSGAFEETEPFVSDAREAIGILLAKDGDREAAVRFLRERGPDPAGYEALEALDGKRPSTPGEAAELISSRARLRTGLCAAWANDPLGEAPARLGCPGARPPPR
jgi:energy-coupling factor transporter ATP-binding protein EcfA2